MDKFEKAFENAGTMTFDRFSFDSPDYDMLVVKDETDYLEHLKVQGAGLAYFTAMTKLAERQYEEYDRKFKFRYNEMYSECSDTLAKSGKKNNIKDIEAFVQCKYEAELKKAYETLDELKARRDYLQAFLEGWKQKSYILTSMTSMITAGLLTPRTTIAESDMEDARPHVSARDILKRVNG